MQQQVEAKVVIHTAQDFTTIINSLPKDDFITEDNHENHFFDGPNGELAGKQAVFRLRFILPAPCSDNNNTSNTVRSILTLKEHSGFEDGSTTRWSRHSNIDADIGRAMIENPTTFFKNINCSSVSKTPSNGQDNTGVCSIEELFAIMKDHFSLTSLVYVGGFNTRRTRFAWTTAKSQSGLHIHLDHTVFPFGERYELEVPNISVPVQDVLEEVIQVLDSLKVGYSMGHDTKFQQLANGRRAASAEAHMLNEAKIVLLNRDALETVSHSIQGGYLTEVEHHDYFFDGPKMELMSRNAYFRVRVIMQRATEGVTVVGMLKEHHGIEDGSAMCWAQEVQLSQSVFSEMMRFPSCFLDSVNSICLTLKSKFGLNSLREIGAFRNIRRKYAWTTAKSQSGLHIHLDHTVFPFGERYELEVPNISVPVQDVLEEVIQVLDSLKV
eukprot:Tbor_TRINITY_DN4233_c0_g1::TRINITY_DN4233_c0_g1_i2::g.23935::m.23935